MAETYLFEHQLEKIKNKDEAGRAIPLARQLRGIA